MSPPSTTTVADLLRDQGCPVNPGRALVRAGLKRRQADRLLVTPIEGEADRQRVAVLGALLAVQSSGGPADQGPATRALALALLADPETVQVSLTGPAWLGPEPWLPLDGRVPPAQARRVHHLLHGRFVAGHQVQVICDPPLRIGSRRPPRESQAVRRRRLFSRWDQGVRWDDEGLFSATPEALAQDLVEGASGVAFDAGCGLGSLSLALARQAAVSRVIAVEADPIRLAHARHNAQLYGVADRIEFRQGDAIEELGQTDCDVLVADPPWGGRAHDRERMTADQLGYDLAALLEHAPADTRLKLPVSFVPESLPGEWSWRPATDHRGVLKFLVATRA